MSPRLAILGGPPVLGSMPSDLWPWITDADIDTVVRLLRDREISYTRSEGQVGDLERRFRDYLGTPYALAVNSGTSALHSAYFGLGLQPGDEVIAPTYTFVATVTPLFAVNAVPVLADVDEWTGNLDPAKVERHITARTRAVAVTHLNGAPADMVAVTAIARRHGLAVVEDCSQAHGAECAGHKVGTFGDAAAFSCQAKKLVAGGEAGVLVTRDEHVYERAVLLGHLTERGREELTGGEHLPFVQTGYGMNLRLSPLNAALANGAFDRLETVIAARERNFAHCDELLADVPGVRPPVRQPHMTRLVRYSYQPLYVPEELDGLPVDVYVAALRAEGVAVERPKSPPLHQMPTFQTNDPRLITYGHFGRGRYRIYQDGDLPASDAYVRRALRLPTYSFDVRDVLERVVDAFRKVADNAAALHELASVTPGSGP